jgi:uncharacterized protein YbbC (DUF1343 family)/CubicO group peptidase (beta-lactamase class C family)
MGGFAKKPKHPKKPKKSKHHKTPKLTADFTAATTLINDAIAAHKLPGAVLLVGHEGEVVFHHAYGNRKLAGEPGLDGNPSPAEPMTEDTIFDMASLTKDLATATAIMQLYEAGKIASFDDPIQRYLPDFNPTADPIRAKVTLRMLLTHTSGEAEDVSLKDPWGLAAPDRAEGFRLALSTPLKSAPAATFRYSDINFILLGMLVEKLSGQDEDVYVVEHIYKPLGMLNTQYHPFSKACGPHMLKIGAAVTVNPPPQVELLNYLCRTGSWFVDDVPRTAPTAHDDESTSNPSANPNFDHLLRGTVHDPTTRRMGGVAGHAGLFSTAHDVSLYAQALLDKLLRNTGPFPLKQSTLQLMVQPEQPGANLQQLVAANLATGAAQRADRERCCVNKDQDPLLAPAYPAIKGQNLRGYGWDIDTAFSKPRGRIFPIGSFGHTGFTGTTLWMDPGSDTWYVLLANAIHPRGGAPISPLRGEVATAVATALGLYGTSTNAGAPSSTTASSSSKVGIGDSRPPSSAAPITCGGSTICDPLLTADQVARFPFTQTQTGIDVLSATNFSDLKPIAAQHDNHLRLGLFTNQAGINKDRRRTVDILATDLPKAIPTAHLVTLFAPEHGLAALVDTERVPDETDAATGLHVTGLYGAKVDQRHPSHEQLKDLDAVVIDLQDAGVHFWTYEAAMGYFLEAASREKNEFNHRLDIIILDRPSLTGGLAVEGPVSDPGISNYTDYMSLPARHGMTFGELARYFNTFKLNAAGQPLNAPLTVIAMRGWTRDQFFDDTHLPWVNPSPNLRDPDAAILYPCIGLIDSANISVGRGTTEPFHIIGASFMNGHDVAAALTARHIPGVTFAPTTIPVAEDSNTYPYHGQTIEAIRFTVTDRVALDTPELGVEILAVLHKLYPAHFQYEKASRLSFFDNRATMEALARGDDPRTIAASWRPTLDAFKANRAKILIY